MKARQRRCTIRLSQAAEDDYRDILRWTEKQFGSRQTLLYAATLSEAIDALRDGARTPGAWSRDEISPGLFVLHVARNRRKGRHLILFRIDERGGEPIVRVIRILHDSMDIVRYL